MIPTRMIAVLMLFIGLAGCQQQHSISEQQKLSLQQEAINIVKQFTNTLKPKLKQALQEGDPADAIEVCSKEAPLLAKQLSQETGWSIKRVSLKARNHNTAIPDQWERETLQRFDQNQTTGSDVATMTATNIENGRFRFMKAQAVGQICLLCHGTDISPNISAALKKHYPKDRALGYKSGEIRGAFSLSKVLDTD